MLLGKLVGILAASDEVNMDWRGVWLAAGLTFVAVAKAFFGAHYTYHISRLGCNVKTALMCAPYEKMLQAPAGISYGAFRTVSLSSRK